MCHNNGKGEQSMRRLFLLMVSIFLALPASKLCLANTIDPRVWSKQDSLELDRLRLGAFNTILFDYDHYYTQKGYQHNSRHKKKFKKVKKHCGLEKIFICHNLKKNKKKVCIYVACKPSALKKRKCMKHMFDLYEWLQVVNQDETTDSISD